MAHPHVLLNREVCQQLRGRVGHRELGTPIFATHASANLAAIKLLRNELRPVADAQDRYAELVNSRIQ